MIELPPDPSTTSTTVAPSPDSQATLHLIEADPGPRAPVAASSGPASAAPDNTWVVQPGESFWSIAQEHLSDVNGHAVSERDVAAYWRQVVELNRPVLVNPDDADLLFVDQVIELPAVTSG